MEKKTFLNLTMTLRTQNLNGNSFSMLYLYVTEGALAGFVCIEAAFPNLSELAKILTVLRLCYYSNSGAYIKHNKNKTS